jgi:hypothetical protein
MSNPNQRIRKIRCRVPIGATTVVIGSSPASTLHGFMPWQDRSFAVTGAEGSCQGEPE